MSRHQLIKGLPICSVSVLDNGVFNNIDEILNYLDDSKYISENHISNLREDAEKLGLDVDKICRETDASRTMEGIYIKVFHDHDF